MCVSKIDCFYLNLSPYSFRDQRSTFTTKGCFATSHFIENRVVTPALLAGRGRSTKLFSVMTRCQKTLVEAHSGPHVQIGLGQRPKGNKPAVVRLNRRIIKLIQSQSYYRLSESLYRKYFFVRLFQHDKIAINIIQCNAFIHY